MKSLGLFQDTVETICAPLFKKTISVNTNNDFSFGFLRVASHGLTKIVSLK